MAGNTGALSRIQIDCYGLNFVMIKIDFYRFIHERVWFGWSDVTYNMMGFKSGYWQFSWNYHPMVIEPLPWHRCFKK